MKPLERWAILTLILAFVATLAASQGPTGLFWALFALFLAATAATTRAQTVYERQLARLEHPDGQ